MAVKQRGRRRSGAAELSFDSLIDVFMNVLGVLMITAVVLALAAPGRVSNPQAPTPQPPVAPPPITQPERPAARLSLPQVQEAATSPLYLLITGDGIRPFSGDDLETTGRFFSLTDLGSSLQLDPIAGRVMSAEELRSWLRQHDPGSRHLSAAITPDGTGYYKEVRTIAAEEGFRSGWLAHEGDGVVLSSGGRTGSLVQ
ncbi:hypothetical protein [Synechococcus sp. 1G10]|uniref:hypothetical protein n=1 Tax=Synechococcus sp. 1G10 TaxID=2025605 RepID=UPI000B991D9F|nr:hypothetical protein [Synechococcus sp. 1G10]